MNLKNFLNEYFQKTKIEIDGLVFNYYDNFNGSTSFDRPVLVFNYGLLCSFEHFKYQMHRFQLENIPMLLMDYRGHHPENTTVNIDEISFEHIADDYLKLFNKLNIKRIDLICHSMGVNVGLELALIQKQLVRSLVLISGSVFPPQNVMFNSHIINYFQPIVENIYQGSPRIFDFVWKKQMELGLVKKFVHLSGFNHRKVTKEFIEIYLNNVASYPPKLFFHLLNLMRNHNILGRIHDITAPALIISGDSDRIIPLHLQSILQEQLRNSELYIVKDGNHVPQIDDPEIVSDRIIRFYEKIATS